MAYGRKTGGKVKGSKNKRTLERERQMQEAAAKIGAALGDKAFDGDAHAFLTAIYKNTDYPVELRADAAKAAIRFEKPALASTDNRNTDMVRYVVGVPAQEANVNDWKAKYDPAVSTPDSKPDGETTH